MGTVLFEEKGELPSMKRFWGGDDRGQCVQLTKREPLEDGDLMFITIPIDDIPALIRRLQSVQKGGKSSGSITENLFKR